MSTRRNIKMKKKNRKLKRHISVTNAHDETNILSYLSAIQYIRTL